MYRTHGEIEKKREKIEQAIIIHREKRIQAYIDQNFNTALYYKGIIIGLKTALQILDKELEPETECQDCGQNWRRCDCWGR